MKNDNLIQFPRRTFLNISLASLVSLMSNGCGGYSEDEDFYDDESDSGGTGVRGLNSPKEILSNPNIMRAISNARSYGASFNLYGDSEVNPPRITGNYSISGERYFPAGIVPLSSGTFKIYNQTANNKINTDYDQVMQTGTSSLGEIIRGNGNSFTIYSILNVQDSIFNCSEKMVFILDGIKSENALNGYYVVAPISSSYRCMDLSGGRFSFSKTSSLKPIVPEEFNGEFNGLIGLGS